MCYHTNSGRRVLPSSPVVLMWIPKMPADSLHSMWPVTMVPGKPHECCSAREPLSLLQIKWYIITQSLDHFS